MVNPIDANTRRVGYSYGYAQNTGSKKNKQEKTEKEIIKSGENQKLVPDDKVLNHLQQDAAVKSADIVRPSGHIKSINTEKYVDEASKARIAVLMSNFEVEDIVAKNLKKIACEFPEMSDDAKQALALALTNQE